MDQLRPRTVYRRIAREGVLAARRAVGAIAWFTIGARVLETEPVDTPT